MFDCHQAEITVMQFTGHSLPVRQSMSVPWEFFTSSHFISQFPPTRFPLKTAIRMCHFLPVHHLGMAFLAGSKAKIQQKGGILISKAWGCVLLFILKRVQEVSWGGSKWCTVRMFLYYCNSFYTPGKQWTFFYSRTFIYFPPQRVFWI